MILRHNECTVKLLLECVGDNRHHDIHAHDGRVRKSVLIDKWTWEDGSGYNFNLDLVSKEGWKETIYFRCDPASAEKKANGKPLIKGNPQGWDYITA